MTSLDINNFSEDSDASLMWDESSIGNTTTTDITDLKSEMAEVNPNIFDLARLINYRANSRRRLRRSSSII